MKIADIDREPLLEMSMKRAAALVDLRGAARPLNLHLIYLFGYRASEETRTHWLNEVLNWLDDVASITLKPDDNRLTERDYYTYLFDERFGPNLVRNVTASHRRIQREKPGLGKPIMADDQIWERMKTFHAEFAKRASKGDPYDDLLPAADGTPL
jgi:hypothetical protein